MMTCLISLIGYNLLPNLLLIKELDGRYDKLLFVTTRRMRGLGRGKRLERALGLKENEVPRIVVSDEDLNEMVAGLKAYPFSPDDDYIINLTGGTHIMSLGSYEFFSRFSSNFYYIPQKKNKIEDVKTSADIPLHYRVNVYEYLTLHGIRFECNEELCKSKEYTVDLFERYKRANYNRYRVPEILNAVHYADDREKSYFSGAWFEEYTYHIIKDTIGLEEGSIYTGVKIYRDDSGKLNDNELDIVYTLDNELYIGECKVSMTGPPESGGLKMLEHYMYKLAAISKDFGINVNPYIFTLYRFGRSQENRMKGIRKRMKILGIKGLIDGDDFKRGAFSLLDSEQ